MKRGACEAAISAAACRKVRDRDGRPSWPVGVSISAATLRRTLSLASACRITLVSEACVIASVRVERVAPSFVSSDRTFAAVSSRSGTLPMIAASGVRTSEYVLMVLADRPGSPSASQSEIAFCTV